MSIKKKFATAVATAGLLAGLFGSALVPSALATGSVSGGADTFKAAYSTIDGQGSDMTRATSTGSTFGFYSNYSVDTSSSSQAWVDFNLYNNIHDDLDLSLAANDGMVLSATSSNANVNIGWAYDQDDAADQNNCDEEAGDGILFGTTSAVQGVNGNGADGNEAYRLCIAAEKLTTAATSTITVKVDGVVAKTITVTAVGPVTSVAIALNSGKYLAAGNNSVDDWATVIAKDAAGTVINGADNTISQEDCIYVEDSEDQVENALGVIDAASSDGCLETNGATHAANTQMPVRSNVCNAADAYGEDGDEGKSYGLKIVAANWNAEDVYVDANTVTITCTGDASGAKVTKVVAEVTSGDTDYVNAVTEATDFAINATIVDADGRPLGNGAGSLSPQGMDFAFKAGIASCLNDATTGFHTVAIDGVAEIGTLSPADCTPGKKSYSVVVANSDLAVSGAGDDPVSKTFVNSYTAAFAGHDGDISRTRNKAKTRATITADFGEDASYGKVTFTVTTSKGVDQIFTRNANGEGVATLVLNRRNTRVYVFADAVDFGDQFVGSTGIIAIRFR